MIIVLASGVVILEDGQRVPVVAWIDKNGDECTIEDAALAVFGTKETGYGFTKLTDSQRITWH